MKLQFLSTSTDRVRHFVRGLVLSCLAPNLVFAQAKSGPSQPASSSCRIELMDYKGWHAQQLSNRWVQLIVVPQNGGRLMQVIFGGHPYLVVNPIYEGKYLPPNPGQWFNYGGDKLWPLPEGNNDEQHWAALTCSTTVHTPFERFRKDNTVK